jgi:hypothetical protein
MVYLLTVGLTACIAPESGDLRGTDRPAPRSRIPRSGRITALLKARPGIDMHGTVLRALVSVDRVPAVCFDPAVDSGRRDKRTVDQSRRSF